MRFPSVLYLLPSIVLQTRSSPAAAGNDKSFPGSLPSPPVVLGRPQLISDPVLTGFPARSVSSASPFDASAFPELTVSGALDSPNSVTPGTFPLTEATPNPGVCQGLIEDLDITGLGVRITFYMTSILTVFDACIPGSDARGSCYAILFTFVALMVSAIAQAANHSISLYNAMMVLYLCYLHHACGLTLALISGLKKRMAQMPDAGVIVKMARLLSFWSWIIFGLYIWLHARTFGSQPECNAATKLVVFGRELSATGSGRVVSLVLFSISCTLSLILQGAYYFPLFFHLRRSSLRHHHSAGPLNPGGTRNPTGPRNPDDTPYIFFLSVQIFAFICHWIYVVVTIEQTIQRNPVIQNGPRFPITFGQIFPVVTIGACLISIYNDLQEFRREPSISQGNNPNVLGTSTKANP